MRIKIGSSGFIIAAVATLLLAACNPAKNITIVSAPMPTLRGMTALEGTMTVENRGARELTVESALLTARYRGQEFVAARLADPVVVSARGMSRVPYRFVLENVGLSTLGVLMRAAGEPEALTLDVDAVVRFGRINKNVKMRGIEMSNIITNFDPSKTQK